MMNDIIVKKIAQLTGHTGAVFAITGGRDAQHILSGAGDGWVVEWDLAQPELGRLVAKVERNIFSLLFLKNKNKIIAGDMDGGVRFVDLAEPSHIRNILHHGGKGCFDLKIIGNHLFTIGGDGILTRWSVDYNRSLESIHLSHKSLRCFDFSKNRNELAIGASDGSVYFVDATTLALKNVWAKTHTNSIFSICYTPDGAHLLTGGRDAHLVLRVLGENTEGGNESDKTPFIAIPAHLFTINSIVFHPKKPYIFATGSRDRTIKIWEMGNGKGQEANRKGQLARGKGQEARGKGQLAKGNEQLPNDEMEIPKVKLLKVIDTIRHSCHARSVNRLFWSDYNDYLISASDDRSLIVWEVLM
jgi:WD40 repeat protein